MSHVLLTPTYSSPLPLLPPRQSNCSEATSTSAPALEVRFIDFDWGGKEGEAVYPAFMNKKANWAIQNPDCTPITQQHDVDMLQASVDSCLQRLGADSSKRQRLLL